MGLPAALVPVKERMTPGPPEQVTAWASPRRRRKGKLLVSSRVKAWIAWGESGRWIPSAGRDWHR